MQGRAAREYPDPRLNSQGSEKKHQTRLSPNTSPPTKVHNVEIQDRI